MESYCPLEFLLKLDTSWVTVGFRDISWLHQRDTLHLAFFLNLLIPLGLSEFVVKNVAHLSAEHSSSLPLLSARFFGGAELASEELLCISIHAPSCSLSHRQISITHFHVFSLSSCHATLASFALHCIVPPRPAIPCSPPFSSFSLNSTLMKLGDVAFIVLDLLTVVIQELWKVLVCFEVWLFCQTFCFYRVMESRSAVRSLKTNLQGKIWKSQCLKNTKNSSMKVMHLKINLKCIPQIYARTRFLHPLKSCSCWLAPLWVKLV